MGTFLRVLSKIMKGITEYAYTKMEISMKGIGTTISRMALAPSNLLMGSSMMANFLKAKNTVKESIPGPTGISISVSLRTIKGMDWGHISGEKEGIIVVNGRETE